MQARPKPDVRALIEDEVELVVPVNGEKRADVRVPRKAPAQPGWRGKKMISRPPRVRSSSQRAGP